MLSIIICHRKIEFLSSVKLNIESTIGVAYELIVIDNSNNTYSILSAYNEGVKRAKFGILCFTHEDVLFHTNKWGEKVIEHFNNIETGMIGVAGSMAQSEIPSTWWSNYYFAKSISNLLFRPADKNDKYLYHYKQAKNATKTEAKIIDGLWFCIRKTLFNKIAFDEKTFNGFHLYDMDISMQVAQHAKVYVVNDILIEHFSNGSLNEKYFIELCRFTDKWKKILPVQTEEVESNYMKIYNWHALRKTVLQMKEWNVSNEYAKEIFDKYYPVAKKRYNSLWFRLYFFISKQIGYELATRIFYKLESLVHFSKVSSYIKTPFEKVSE